MELFPSQPDLYLKIKRRREEQEEDYKEQEEVQRRLLFGSKASDSDRKASDHLIHTLQFTSNNEPTKIDHNQEHMESLDQDLRSNFMVRPIRGIPLHQNQILTTTTTLPLLRFSSVKSTVNTQTLVIVIIFTTVIIVKLSRRRKD